LLLLLFVYFFWHTFAPFICCTSTVAQLLEPLDPDEQAMEADDYTPEELDEYLTAEVLLPHGGDNVRALVKEGVTDDQGRHVGFRNSNPMLDTRKYQVQFPDGSTDGGRSLLLVEDERYL
jgi:hypothetical protein